jgi:hypothetical protein
MSATINEPKLLGLFELDDRGTVLYSSFETAEGTMIRQPGFDGSDFFEVIACFSNVEDFHHRFDVFRMAGARSSSFEFTCQYPDGPRAVRVILARLTDDSAPESFLVHLKRP